MKSFTDEGCASYYCYAETEVEEAQRNFESLLERSIPGGDFAGREASFSEANMGEEYPAVAYGKEELLDGELETEGDDSQESAAEAVDEFEEDHITCYLKEVSTYPLLTAEREIELAQTIRQGQETLEGLVEEHAPTERLLYDLDQKVRKLLAHEDSFPGVRDKVLKVIIRTLERAAKDHPENRLYVDLMVRSRTIMWSIDNAKHELVSANLRLVLSIAKRYRGRGMSFDDLIQEGNLGLLKAVGRYDHTKGNRFSTYATWWVRQSIIRGIYDKTRTIRLPVHFIELKNLFFKVYYELLKELGREPVAHEIAERANLPVDKVQTVLTLAVQPVSLEAPVGEDEQRLGDFLVDDHAASPLDQCSDKELAETTRELLSGLQPREEKILRLRFGLDGQPAETLEKIGKTFNVSKERIRQIEKKALRKLRNPNRQALLRAFVD
ncbi:MAG: sigma-70 family RNA polymerase sigma factor [Syntrophobacteraceae bacterium]